MGNGVTCLRIYGVILKFTLLGTLDSHIQRGEEREEREQRDRDTGTERDKETIL